MLHFYVYKPSIIVYELSLVRLQVHYENTPMQYTAIFTAVKITIFNYFRFTIFIFLLKTYIVGIENIENGVYVGIKHTDPDYAKVSVTRPQTFFDILVHHANMPV